MHTPTRARLRHLQIYELGKKTSRKLTVIQIKAISLECKVQNVQKEYKVLGNSPFSTMAKES